MTHPLTDEICLEITNRPYTVDTRMADLRSAADWQLKKCDDELGNILHCLAIAGKITGEERIQLYVLFKEAMRPQEDN